MKRILVYAFIALYPIMPDYFRIFGFPSGSFLACLFVFLSFLVNKKLLTVRKEPFVLCFISSVLICSPYIYNREYSTAVRLFIEYFFVILILCEQFINEKEIINAFEIIVSVSLITCFFAFFEFLTKTSLFTFLYSGVQTDLSPALQTRGSFVRSEITFGHAITYAIYLGFCTLLNSYVIAKTKKRKYIIIYIVQLFALLTTISRAPIITFVISQAIILYMFGFKKFINIVIKILVIFSLMLFVVSIILPNFYDSTQNIINIVLGVFSKESALKAGDFENADAFKYRIELLKVLPSFINDSWLVGHGASLSFNFRMLGHTYRSIDNAYLLILLRYGMIGLIGYFLLPFVLVVKCMKNFNKSQVAMVFFVVIIFYLLNLFSVAQMAEYKIWIIILSLGISLSMHWKSKVVVNNSTVMNTKQL